MKALSIGLVFCASAFAGTSTHVPIFQIESRFDRLEAGSSVTQHSLGFAVESDGFLLTTYNELTDPSTGELSQDIIARFSNGDLGQVAAPLQIIGVEPTMNFAVLKLETDEPLEVGAFYKDRGFVKGDPVVAYALGSDGKLISVPGLFSQLNELECYQMSLTGTMLKAFIDIPESGLGSPVLNQANEIFAINTGYRPLDDDDDKEEAYLLPMSLALTVYEGIKQRRNLASPWTGFSVRGLNSAEQQLFPFYGGKIKGGIGLEHIWEDGPAQALGIREGDILVKFGSYPIESVGDFQKWLYMYGVGHTVKLYFLRNDKLMTFDYTIEERPDWAKPR